MRTYDPADCIVYVHLAQDPAAPAAPPRARDDCRRLPTGYANSSPRARLGEPLPARARPALVVLPGGAATAPAPSRAAPALRLAGSTGRPSSFRAAQPEEKPRWAMS